MEEEKELSIFEEHPRTTFWTRFFLYVMFGCVLPVSFIVWRFELFTSVHMSFGGWGLVAIVIIFLFAKSLLDYLKAGLVEHIFLGQCIKGAVRVILPLVALYFVLTVLRDNINTFLQALGCVIVCEIFAIPLNPMPQWVHDNAKDEEKKKFTDFSDILWDRVFSRKGEKDV